MTSNVSRLDLINNCREPGNWEFNIHETVEERTRRVLHAYFYIPVEYLDPRLRRYTGYGWRESRVGLRFPRRADDPSKPHAKVPEVPWLNRQTAKSVNVLEEKKGGDLAMMWWAMPSFPDQCNISELKRLFPNLPTGNSGKNADQTKKLVSVGGPIDYRRLPYETRAKSGIETNMDGRPVRQTLSFVKSYACKPNPTSLAKTPPQGFNWPFAHDGPNREALSNAVWAQNCAIVPHTYRNWEDVRRYQIRLSGFEGDGTYGCAVKGKTRSTQLVHRRQKLNDDLNCWKFDYDQYLSNYDQYLMTRRDGFTEVHLMNTNTATYVRNSLGGSVVIGFNEEKLRSAGREGLHFLLGYNSKKLFAPYDAIDVERDRPHYAFVVDERGFIKDHYGPSNFFRWGVGIGKVQVRLEGERNDQKLVVTLISHERIMPLIQFKIDYGDRDGVHETPYVPPSDKDRIILSENVGPAAASHDANVTLDDAEAAFRKAVTGYKPGDGEAIVADAILSHGMTYHAVIVKTKAGLKLRRYMPDGAAWTEAGVALQQRDGAYWEQSNRFDENFKVNGDTLEFHDQNGLVAKAPIIKR